MRGRTSSGLIIAFWCGFAATAATQQQAPPKKAPTAEEFETSWKSLNAATQRGEWKNAKQRLEALLAAHAEADYVRAKRDEIIIVHRHATFREKAPLPDPKKLVTGKLVTWEPGSGRIRIEYVAEKMGDWIKGAEGDDSPWEHPATFTGAHSIEIKVKNYPVARVGLPIPNVFVCANEKSILRASFGLAARQIGDVSVGAPAVVDRLTPGIRTPETLAENAGAAVAPGPATLKVSVTDTAVTLSGGAGTLSARKARGETGRLAIAALPEFERIVIEGKIEPSWLQGLVDGAESKAREAFEAGYRPEDAGLPAWLFAKARTTKSAAKEPAVDVDALPDALTSEQSTALDRLFKQRPADRRRALEKLSDAELPAATRLLLIGEARMDYDDFVSAAIDLRGAVKAAPNNVRALYALAAALSRTGDDDEAAEYALRAFTLAPHSAEIATLAARELFYAGRLEEAARTRDAALAAGARSKLLDDLGPILAKAAHGPDWSRREKSQSEHYEVATDLDRATAQEATKVLEESYQAYVGLFGRPKGKPKRARVFLFSGEDGYRRYATDVLGDVPMQTAGVYSPVVKQLLIWNLPTREAMFKTVRHEGLHQFVDAIMRSSPIWLNEGLAEYFESVRIVNGSWKKGDVRKDHVSVLRSASVLSRFLRIEPAAFYASAELNYPQAWSLVHFLLHGTPQSRKVFDDLVKRLREGQGAATAIEEVFTPEVLTWFEPAYDLHLSKLRLE